MGQIDAYLKKITDKSEEFIKLCGQEQFDKIYTLKKELGEYIYNLIKCNGSYCTKAFSTNYKCCFHCDKTFGAFRCTAFYDILSKEDAEELVKAYKKTFGFVTNTSQISNLACGLPISMRSFVCNTYTCRKDKLSKKAKTLIALYCYILRNYKFNIDNNGSASYANSWLKTAQEHFDNLKNKPDDTYYGGWLSYSLKNIYE